MNPMRNKLRGILLLLTTALLLCTGQYYGAQQAELPAGAKIVHNLGAGAWGGQPKVELKLLRKIGDVDTTDDHFAFNEPNDVAVDVGGNIYILDSGNCRIQKFSPEGKFLSSIGRKGQGPGEFGRPTSFDIDAKGFIYVVDYEQKRLVKLKPSGGQDRSYSIKELGLYSVRILNSGLIASVAPPGPSRAIKPGVPVMISDPPAKLIKLFDAEFKPKVEVGEPFDYKDNMSNLAGNALRVETGQDDFVYSGYLYQNRIEKYASNGKLLWKADRPLGYSLGIIAKGGIEMRGNSVRSFSPRMNRCTVGLGVDLKSRVWVLTMARQLRDEEQVGTTTSYGPSGMTRKITGNTDLRTTDAYRLDVLLSMIPLSHFADGIRVVGDSLFILDQLRGVTYYQYKIVER